MKRLSRYAPTGSGRLARALSETELPSPPKLCTRRDECQDPGDLLRLKCHGQTYVFRLTEIWFGADVVGPSHVGRRFDYVPEYALSMMTRAQLDRVPWGLG
jgi:hypothetical protein